MIGYIPSPPLINSIALQILNCRDVFYKYCRKKVGDGLNTRFWEDSWIGIVPLSR